MGGGAVVDAGRGVVAVAVVDEPAAVVVIPVAVAVDGDTVDIRSTRYATDDNRAAAFISIRG